MRIWIHREPVVPEDRSESKLPTFTMGAVCWPWVAMRSASGVLVEEAGSLLPPVVFFRKAIRMLRAVNLLGLSPSTHRASDLIGYWKFDENASLSVAADSSGNELNGTIDGSPQRLAGVRGGAFYFDGSDDRVFLPYDPKMALDKYSVSFWIYPERNISDSWTGLFGRAGRNYAIWLGNSNPRKLSFYSSPLCRRCQHQSRSWKSLTSRVGINGTTSFVRTVGLVRWREPLSTEVI